jgi:Integrase core domain
MIRDRDRIYGSVVTRRLRAMGIRDRPITPASPWQNAFAERLIGSNRRECVDHVIVLGEAHLRRVLKSCAGFSSGSANRKHRITRHPWRTSPSLRPSLSFRYTQGDDETDGDADEVAEAAKEE